jgi:GDSL-like lipase/acylhydrolase family protein
LLFPQILWLTGAFRSATGFVFSVFSFGPTLLCASDGLQPGDVVAICGDSITEQGLYSALIETYLLACQPVSDVRTHQFGLSGETSWQFLNRIHSDVLPLRPTVATMCYGMNDGGYGSVDPEREMAYRRATTEIVQGLKRGGVRLVVVGSPGAVDTDFFDKAPRFGPTPKNTIAERFAVLLRLPGMWPRKKASDTPTFTDSFAKRWKGQKRSLGLATMSQVLTVFTPRSTVI